MARKPVSMRKAKEILRLKHEQGLTNRQIGACLNLSHVSVGKYLRRAATAGLGWPLPENVREDAIDVLLLAGPSTSKQTPRPLPDATQIHRELQRKHVTLRLLWEEYRREHLDGYGYTQYCEHYRRFRDQLEPRLRQTYKAGEKLFVDWTGDTIPITDAQTGQTHPASLFVAVMGASDYIFATAFESRQQAFWIEAHIQAWEFFGGATEITVLDNEKTGVDRACRYEPDLNRCYAELATHYGTVVIPARPNDPRGKAKVENAVLHAERRIMAVLRNMTFFSLGELNTAIRNALRDINERPFQKLPGSRREHFEQVDRPVLRPLPSTRYETARWQHAKVNIDYHIQADWHFYSVPYRLVNQAVEVRLTARTVEVFHRERRVALHPRSYERGKATTDPAHRPLSHQRHLDWTPGRIIHWAETDVGASAAQVITHIMEHWPHPEMGYRSSLGVMNLARLYGKERLEQACRRALQVDACSYRCIKSMLKTGLDAQPIPADPPIAKPVVHVNLRGATYYQNNQHPNEEGLC
ncbi:MAG: IS21 family transposase [Phycisphaerales bacterium]|nr:IS21 family transposase [Phycisphaerales bacterium]